MQDVASWATVAETTFVLPPSQEGADYRCRIFTPSTELPFAGHPTLGTAHAWLAHHGQPYRPLVQECPAGLVAITPRGPRLAFAAPALVRSGPVDEAELSQLAKRLGLQRADVVDAQWVDNGPGWVGLLLADAQAVLALRPGLLDRYVGVVGFYPSGSPLAYEVRVFTPGQGGMPVEDPVTGSFNASVAGWLLDSGRAVAPYVVGQGSALGRRGRVYIDQDGDGTVWVGGDVVSCVSGTIDI